MAFITIRDLPQSDALDRRAMLSIVGGASGGMRLVARRAATAGSERIVDYPPGFGGLGREWPAAAESERSKGRQSEV
jgi:hypothetical protein